MVFFEPVLPNDWKDSIFGKTASQIQVAEADADWYNAA
jgi:hypothetical protein